jgi:hypothetical protein
VVAVTNRRKTILPSQPRSRGALCRDLLDRPTAAQATDHAFLELETGKYAGANYVCVDPNQGWAIHAGDRLERMELSPGIHLMGNEDLDDPVDERLAHARRLFVERPVGSVAQFLATSAWVCAHGASSAGEPAIVVHGPLRGTVSSTLIVLADDPRRWAYWHAAGPPDHKPYEDYSALLRGLFP